MVEWVPTLSVAPALLSCSSWMCARPSSPRRIAYSFVARERDFFSILRGDTTSRAGEESVRRAAHPTDRMASFVIPPGQETHNRATVVAPSRQVVFGDSTRIGQHRSACAGTGARSNNFVRKFFMQI